MDATPAADRVRLRRATEADVDSIAQLWFAGWPDGHQGNVPEELLEHRHYEHFLSLVPSRIPQTTVAELADDVIGFVTIHHDEVEQMYVGKAARGSGIAGLLLSEGERQIGQHHEKAWLAVVAGNARARRFYERQGWREAGAFAYAAEITNGTLAVPALRYEKVLDR